MDFKVVLPLLISFAITIVLCPIVIPFLKKLKLGQYIRGEGPQSHQKKSGTPTMGGIIILVSIVLTCLFYIKDYPNIIPILFVTLGYGLIGFLDDYIKIVMKRNLGLKAWQKMLGQLIVTAVFEYYIMNFTDVGTAILIPFSGGKLVDMSWMYIPMFFVVMLGTVNGSNFTDGLDGLETSVTILIATFFAVVTIIAPIGANSGINPIILAVVGSLLGFLGYNLYPAKVFMGDTGSLALGGFVASTACVLRMPLFIILVALIYLVEILSVMIQVMYFKVTGGKRIFKMAPIHHHFELCGWSETRVVTVFSIITAILCITAFWAI
ncbi:phospho-N-acetylmuramoyl-pentapeptide-transferase [Anaerosporobacter sp.]|uniref:phospho-N-acetylmuramoyl-pentapeptide- transferase n=1 Tax=Anaerosporobacter sp. TaxID=1872529 RepID=UPI00286EEAFD|nr:phospho-N-acetylmuramoyl-pentapeptide-transferase [Anaerosporobacter sp.]